MMKINWKFLLISFIMAIATYGILYAVSNLLEFHYSYRTYSPIIAVIISIIFFTFKLEEFNKKEFRKNYESEISKKLNLSEVIYYKTFSDEKSHIVHIPMGILSLGYGIYFLWNKYIAGILCLMVAAGFLYMSFRKKVVYVQLSKEGIYTSDFGFLYFKHIEAIDFYRTYGRTYSAYMKIYMKNHQLYKMKEPFLLQSISACKNRKELVSLLINKTDIPIRNYDI